jgi:hypothetical protein
MVHIDPYPTRIDYLPYHYMQQIDDLVRCVLRFATENPNSDTEDYIRQVTERIEDVVEGRVGPHEYVQIVMLLRSLVHFVRVKPNEDEANQPYALSITNRIIETIQGENPMSNATLNAMTFRRVKEAILKVVDGNGPLADINDENITAVAEEYTDKIMSDVFGNKTPAEIQATEYVGKFFEMDPETDDLLDNGTLVIDGMKVLFEDNGYRADPREGMSAGDTDRAKKSNRWCVVSNSKVKVDNNGNDMLSFIGTYDDGTKRKWDVSARYAWFVKKDTIPRVDGIYRISDETIIYNGLPDQVVGALRSMYVDAWEKHLVRVGGSDFETVSQYLWRVERIESEDATELEKYKTLVDRKGQYVATGKNDVLLKAYIERYVEPSSFNEYRVTVWDQENPIPLPDYLGINDELIVSDDEGTQVFKGTRKQIQIWAATFTSGRRGGYVVSREGEVGGISLRDFMQRREL